MDETQQAGGATDVSSCGGGRCCFACAPGREAQPVFPVFAQSVEPADQKISFLAFTWHWRRLDASGVWSHDFSALRIP